MLIPCGLLIWRLVCGATLLLRAGLWHILLLLRNRRLGRVLIADAHHIQVMVRHKILFLFVKVYIAAREDHEIVLPVIGQPSLPHTERRQHLLEGAFSNDALLLLELTYYCCSGIFSR